VKEKGKRNGVVDGTNFYSSAASGGRKLGEKKV